MIFFNLIFNLIIVNALHYIQHPLEKRIAYVYGINNINKIDEQSMNNLHELFIKHPLLIFKDLDVWNVLMRLRIQLGNC